MIELALYVCSFFFPVIPTRKLLSAKRAGSPAGHITAALMAPYEAVDFYASRFSQCQYSSYQVIGILEGLTQLDFSHYCPSIVQFDLIWY